MRQHWNLLNVFENKIPCIIKIIFRLFQSKAQLTQNDNRQKVLLNSKHKFHLIVMKNGRILIRNFSYDRLSFFSNNKFRIERGMINSLISVTICFRYLLSDDLICLHKHQSIFFPRLLFAILEYWVWREYGPEGDALIDVFWLLKLVDSDQTSHHFHSEGVLKLGWRNFPLFW